MLQTWGKWADKTELHELSSESWPWRNMEGKYQAIAGVHTFSLMETNETLLSRTENLINRCRRPRLTRPARLIQKSENSTNGWFSVIQVVFLFWSRNLRANLKEMWAQMHQSQSYAPVQVVASVSISFSINIMSMRPFTTQYTPQKC